MSFLGPSYQEKTVYEEETPALRSFPIDINTFLLKGEKAWLRLPDLSVSSSPSLHTFAAELFLRCHQGCDLSILLTDLEKELNQKTDSVTLSLNSARRVKHCGMSDNSPMCVDLEWL